MRSVAVGLVLLCGCFNSGVAPLRCSEAHPGCPDGYECRAGQCEDKTVSDASSVQDGGNDQSMLDMVDVPGCSDGKGFKIGTQGCWACSGVFGAAPKPKASELCAPTHAPPPTSSKIDDAACMGVTSGFYLSAAYGATSTNFSDPNFSQCGFFTMGAPGFFGCGVAEGSGTVNAAAACAGFRMAIQCRTSNGIFCTKETLDQIQNSRPTNGVLCCPK